VELEGGIYTSRLGGDDFDMRYTENWLAAQAAKVAKALNDQTQADVNESGVEAAFDRAFNERLEVAAVSIGTRSTVWAREEAAKKHAPFPESRVKTWIPHTDRHAELGGKSVPLRQSWEFEGHKLEPGSAVNCACTLVIS
jgi:hypothetical protein